jgi:hypothetical protein
MQTFNRKLKKLGISLTLALLVAPMAWSLDAAPTAAAAHKAHPTHLKAIEQVMKKQFDTPQDPLTVRPITLEGDYAVAGWTQGARGGRALLRLEKGHWQIALCGGDGLLQAEALAQAGLTPAAAKRLAFHIQQSEARLSPAQRKQLSLFGGIVRVDAAHGAHPGKTQPFTTKH